MLKPLVLVIFDGFGISSQKKGNAILSASTPNYDTLLKTYPHATLQAAGKAVGLPKNQMGNSEVGHLNIGGGQIVYTGLSLIDKAIEDQTFFKNEAFLKTIEHVKKNNSTLHLIGLLSPGGVHSSQEHLWKLLDLAYQQKVKSLTVDVFCDGRDVSPRSIKPWLQILITKLKKYNYKIGAIMGRLYAMDRDQRFEKTQLAFEAICGQANLSFKDPLAYIDSQYQKNLNDEFIEPAINADLNVKFLKDNDGVIFYNFRPDRARQLSHFIVGSSLYAQNPPLKLKNIVLTTMMPYEGIEKALVAFDIMKVDSPLGKVLQDANLKQLRTAETQKYAHVTFFFDGGKDIKYKLEDRILVDSAKIDNFANKPIMSAPKITEVIIDNLKKYDVIIANYANADMVGHTGDYQAAIKAIEFLDQELGKLYQAIKKAGGVLFLTADHGNAEEMLDDSGKSATKHTSNPVPLIITDQTLKLKDGILADVSPTILDYLKIKKPLSMTNNSLIIK